MKKTIFNLLVILAFASSAAYAGQTIASTGTTIGSQPFKPSNNVTVFIASKAGDPTNPGGYSAGSAHSNGNREFVTNSVEPKIFWRDKPASQNLSASDVTCTSSTAYGPSIASGWNSL